MLLTYWVHDSTLLYWRCKALTFRSSFLPYVIFMPLSRYKRWWGRLPEMYHWKFQVSDVMLSHTVLCFHAHSSNSDTELAHKVLASEIVPGWCCAKFLKDYWQPYSLEICFFKYLLIHNSVYRLLVDKHHGISLQALKTRQWPIVLPAELWFVQPLKLLLCNFLDCSHYHTCSWYNVLLHITSDV